MKKEIWFDMDGTIANLYGENEWLEDIKNEKVRPYENAKVMVNMQVLARVLNRLTREGYAIGVITWTARGGTKEYNNEVAKAKRKWLNTHLATVKFNAIHVIEYGVPKWTMATDRNAILFDDEERNRKEWQGIAYDEKNIIEVLKKL